MKTPLDKTSSMMDNPHKLIVRTDLVQQIMQWAQQSRVTSLSCASLCADQYAFEYLLKHHAAANDIALSCRCAEANFSVYERAVRNRPSFASILYGSFNELMFGHLSETNEGILWRNIIARNSWTFRNAIPDINKFQCRVTGHERTQNNFDIVFADYCCNPTSDQIQDAIDSMTGMKSGLYYVTFNLLNRQEETKVAIRSLLKDCGLNPSTANLLYDDSDKTLSYADAIRAVIVSKAKSANLSIQAVYAVKYCGNGKKPMLTLGFEVGTKHLPKSKLEDRTKKVSQDSNEMAPIFHLKRHLTPPVQNRSWKNRLILPGMQNEIEKSSDKTPNVLSDKPATKLTPNHPDYFFIVNLLEKGKTSQAIQALYPKWTRMQIAGIKAVVTKGRIKNSKINP